MKTRSGFVSNSSSASFIITVKDTEKNIRNKFVDVIFPTYRLTGHYERLLTFYEKMNAKKQVIKDIQKQIKDMDEMTIQKWEKVVLQKLTEIGIGVKKVKGGFQFRYYTTMYNDYYDIPDIMKNIVFGYASSNEIDKINIQILSDEESCFEDTWGKSKSKRLGFNV